LENFAPWSALAGGALLGLSAMILMLGLGRVAGIAGIVGGLRTDHQELPWRGAFIVGLVLGPMLCIAWSAAPLEITVNGDLPMIVSGGLLVGFGTRLGSGCTSGHGVCGIARLSLRSLVATAVFMLAAGVVVFITRHVA
jgi:uncharacterized protein